MAKLILTDDDQGKEVRLNAGANFELIGTSGVDRIVVAAGANANLNLLGGDDLVTIEGNAGDYTVQAQGLSVIFTFSDSTTVTVPVSTSATRSITFGSGETLGLELDLDQGAIVLGSQVLSSEPETVTAEGGTSTETTSLDGEGTDNTAEVISASTDSFEFSDSFAVANNVEITGFGSDDSLTFSGVTFADLEQSYVSDGTSASITLNNNGIVSSVELVGVGGSALTLDAFNALSVGDIGVA
ncbi:hypothetical protein OLMES_0926 [Oleiphilus messinensis]|uniref:Uncharacterized protein n=1 Tax=Oleiphilus messinensis TaxID=141451 RepID=A0A1Y0I6I6_9GAMM|nr:hypothetical protein [Oleiphilus messinensis]ARU55013.1 hypothetical protein OLMES_0926 [Oleiphilus messinensis]